MINNWKEKLMRIFNEINLVNNFNILNKSENENEKVNISNIGIIIDETIINETTTNNLLMRISEMQNYLIKNNINNEILIITNKLKNNNYSLRNYRIINITENINTLLLGYDLIIHYLSEKKYYNDLIQKILNNIEKPCVTYLSHNYDVKFKNNNNLMIALDKYSAQKYYQKTHNKCYILNDYIINPEKEMTENLDNPNIKIIGCVCDSIRENNIDKIIDAIGKIKFLIDDLQKYEFVFSNNGDLEYIEYLKKLSEDFHINCKFANLSGEKYDLLLFLNNSEDFDYKLLKNIFNEKNQYIITYETKAIKNLIAEINDNNIILSNGNDQEFIKILYNKMLMLWYDKPEKNKQNLREYIKKYSIETHYDNLNALL